MMINNASQSGNLMKSTMGIYVDVIISVVSRDGSELDKQKQYIYNFHCFLSNYNKKKYFIFINLIFNCKTVLFLQTLIKCMHEMVRHEWTKKNIL